MRRSPSRRFGQPAATGGDSLDFIVQTTPVPPPKRTEEDYSNQYPILSKSFPQDSYRSSRDAGVCNTLREYSVEGDELARARWRGLANSLSPRLITKSYCHAFIPVHCSPFSLLWKRTMKSGCVFSSPRIIVCVTLCVYLRHDCFTAGVSRGYDDAAGAHATVRSRSPRVSRNATATAGGWSECADSNPQAYSGYTPYGSQGLRFVTR